MRLRMPIPRDPNSFGELVGRGQDLIEEMRRDRKAAAKARKAASKKEK